MALRNGHGTGAGVPRVEVMPPNEQPYSETGVPGPIETGRDSAGRVRSSAAARAMAKLPRRGAFMPRKLACDPRFEPHNQRRLEWLRARRVELHNATGGVSHGVGAMLASSAWLYAAAEFAAELAAESADTDLFKTSAALSSTARQHDLAAWELATREGAARKAASQDSAPWLATADSVTPGAAAKPNSPEEDP